MNDLILHISDLHVSDHSGTFGRSYDDTFLTVQNDELNYTFISSFVDFIKEQKYKNLFLIITGDITDCGEISEFEISKKYISKIVTDLQIPITNVLVIPGDHDINRGVLKTAVKDKGLDAADAHTLHEEKLNHFLSFYLSIKNSDFNWKKLIFDFIVTDHVLFLGVNSNYKIGLNGGSGYLSPEPFENELKELKKQYPEKEFVICMHHNLHGEHEDKQSGQWDLANRKNLISVFQRNRIKCILNGNEHTPNSKILDTTDIIISDSGPLSCIKNPHGSFKSYELIHDESGLYIQNRLFKLISNGGTNETQYGNWSDISITNTKGSEQERFILKQTSLPFLDAPIELPSENSVEINQKDEDTSLVSQIDSPDYTTAEIDLYSNEEIQNELYKIIKDKSLFNQGHFHWSATSRAHNWIDISRLLEDRENLFFIKNAIINIIESKTQSNFDMIIGLGYEGNIISTKASIKYNVPYVFLPYSYRYKDHHKFENKLNFDNSDGKYKKILIITDVVNDGRTIRKLIGKEDREKKFFDKVNEVIVISLFYTGSNKNLNHDILNYNKLPDIYDKHNDHEVNNLRFYFIKALQVEKCPYGEDYKTACLIYKDDLNCVHKFYTEED